MNLGVIRNCSTNVLLRQPVPGHCDHGLMCLPPVAPLEPEQIKRIRETLRVNQAVFAQLLNTSHSTVQKWESVQKDMGVALFIAQLGRTAGSAKPWKGLGSGVYELVEDFRGDAFRAVCCTCGRCGSCIACVSEKSKAGVATPLPDVDLIEKRLKAVLVRHGLGGRRRWNTRAVIRVPTTYWPTSGSRTRKS